MGERPTLWVNCSHRWWDDEAPCKYTPPRLWHPRKHACKAGETRVNTRGNLTAFLTGTKCTYMRNIHISRCQYRCLLHFTLRRERAHLIDGVWVTLNRTRPRVQTARFGLTQTISYLLYRLILCIMDLIVFPQCFTHTHARTTLKSALFSNLMSSRSITVLRMLSIIWKPD